MAYKDKQGSMDAYMVRHKITLMLNNLPRVITTLIEIEILPIPHGHCVSSTTFKSHIEER